MVMRTPLVTSRHVPQRAFARFTEEIGHARIHWAQLVWPPPVCFYFTPWFASTFQDWSDYIWATSATSWFLASPCFILNPLHPTPRSQKSGSGRSETVESRNPPKYIKIHRAVVFLFPVSRPTRSLAATTWKTCRKTAGDCFRGKGRLLTFTSSLKLPWG